MAQTTILAAGSTDASSSDVVVAAGSNATVGMFVASGTLPTDVSLAVVADTPGADIIIANLTTQQPAVVLAGPGTFRVVRTVGRLLGSSVAVGAFSEA